MRSGQFNLLDHRGEPLLSFGQAPRRDSGWYPCIARTPVAAANPNRFWAVRPLEYALDGWEGNGALFATVTVSASPWYDPADAAPRLGPNERPRSRLLARWTLC